MKLTIHRAGPGIAIVLGAVVSAWSAAQQPVVPDFVYRAQRGDTLIGLSQRALVEPGRWRELQRRNQIANPLRIPLGFEIRIPVDWLKQSVVEAEALQVVGAVQVDGRVLAKGERLAEGAQVTTGQDGFVTLRFGDGGLAIVQSNSRLIVQRLRRYDGVRQHDTQLRLESGRANSSVTPKPAVGRFEIATPVAVSAVRGTEFRTQFDSSQTLAGAGVTVGSVDVRGARSAARVVLPQGFGTTTDASGVPAPPAVLLAAPKWLETAEEITSRTLVLAVEPVAGAVRYQSQLASDADFQAVVAESTTNAPEVRLEGLADGTYWVRVHAVDARTLAGFDATRRVTVRALPEPPALTLPADRAKQSGTTADIGWAPSAEANDYRLQIAADEAFAQPLRDLVVTGALSHREEGLPPGVYYWRVAALRGDGLAGIWSATRRFEQKALPVAPMIALADRNRANVTWQAQPGESHRLQVSSDAGFTAIRVDEVVQAGEFVWANAPTGTYHVRVQTTDADGHAGPWSPAAQVTVPVPPWVKWMPLVSLLFLL